MQLLDLTLDTPAENLALDLMGKTTGAYEAVFNNDLDNTSGMGVGQDPHYVETSEGRLIDAKGVKGRFVRLYSNGNNANDLNHYIEVEVWGKPLK